MLFAGGMFPGLFSQGSNFNNISMVSYFTNEFSKWVFEERDALTINPSAHFVALHLHSGLNAVLQINIDPEPNQILNIYPNPFSNSATIKYHLEKYSHVHIVLYDILGKKMSDILDENMKAGDHYYVFDSDKAGLPNGIYYLQMTSEDRLITRKVVKN
jgi:hypothetical protein